MKAKLIFVASALAVLVGSMAWLRGGIGDGSWAVLRSTGDLDSLRSLIQEESTWTTLRAHVRKQAILDINSIGGEKGETLRHIFALGSRHGHSSRSFLLRFQSSGQDEFEQLDGRYFPATSRRPRVPAIPDVDSLDAFRAFLLSDGYPLIRDCLARHQVYSLRLGRRLDLQEERGVRVFDFYLFASPEKENGPLLHARLWYAWETFEIENFEILTTLG